MGSTGDVAVGVLRRRIERLDEHLRPIMPIDADPRVLHFIIVMQTYTDTMMHSECGGRAVIGASLDCSSGPVLRSRASTKKPS